MLNHKRNIHPSGPDAKHSGRRDVVHLLALPVLSAFLYWLSSPAWSLSLVVWVCLVPLGHALHQTSPGRGFASGLFYGVCFWLFGAWWLKNALVSMVHLPPWQAWGWTLVFCALHGLPYALFGYLAARLRLLESQLGVVLAAAALAVIRLWYPHMFPGSEANSLSPWPVLIQALDFGGVPLLLFCVYLVNFQLVRAVIGWRSRQVWLPSLVCAAAVLAFLAGYGGWRLHELHGQMAAVRSGQQITVLSIQPDAPIDPKSPEVPTLDRGNNITTVLALSIEGARRCRSADLIVWPELPFAFDRQVANSDLPLLVQVTGKALMLPCTVATGDNGATHYSSVTFIDKDGRVGEEYRKLLLVPFGEYLPLEGRFPLMRKLFPGVLAFSAGTQGPVVYDLGEGRRLIPSLCYEAIFTGHTRRFVERGGNVLVNMVDDAWFGDSPASLAHLSMALFRTVEYRIPMVRVTNSGVGVFVQPTGEVVPGSQTPLFQKAATAHTLFIPQERSFYSRFGDVFLHALTAALLLGLGYFCLRRPSCAQEACSDTDNNRRTRGRRSRTKAQP